MMMPLRKPLVLAMLAAGVIASDGLPEAQSTVFVAELAMLDGAVCVGAMPVPTAPMLVAQAKTEVSPAAKAAASGVPLAATDQPLIPGLGTRGFKITTASKEAQQYFDQGLRLAWELQPCGGSARVPEGAAARSGMRDVLLGRGLRPRPEHQRADGPAGECACAAAAAKASSLAGQASPREQALIAAVVARYGADPKVERPALDAAYAECDGRAAADALPDDLDIAAIYAEALMDRSPWDYWEAGRREGVKPVVAPLVRHARTRARRSTRTTSARSTSTSTRSRRRRDAKRAEALRRSGSASSRPAPVTSCTCRRTSTTASVATGLARDQSASRSRSTRPTSSASPPQGVYPLAYYPHNVHFVMVSAQLSGEGRS